MIPTVKWIERTWKFDLPLGLYPNVVDRLRGVPARIEDKIAAWPREWIARRVGVSWSVQEHIGHLLDLEALGMGRLDDFEAELEVLRAADMTNRRTHEANYNSVPLENILDKLRQERLVMVARLEQYDEAMIGRVSLHPRLQMPLRLIDLVYFIAEHDDHHLVRMNETMDALVRAR